MSLHYDVIVIGGGPARTIFKRYQVVRVVPCCLAGGSPTINDGVPREVLRCRQSVPPFNVTRP